MDRPRQGLTFLMLCYLLLIRIKSYGSVASLSRISEETQQFEYFRRIRARATDNEPYIRAIKNKGEISHYPPSLSLAIISSLVAKNRPSIINSSFPGPP